MEDLAIVILKYDSLSHFSKRVVGVDHFSLLFISEVAKRAIWLVWTIFIFVVLVYSIIPYLSYQSEGVPSGICWSLGAMGKGVRLGSCVCVSVCLCVCLSVCLFRVGRGWLAPSSLK